jgi:hypothetical protein
VALPLVGTAYVSVEAEDDAAAIGAAYRQVRRADIEDWRAIRAPVEWLAPSVVLERDTTE